MRGYWDWWGELWEWSDSNPFSQWAERKRTTSAVGGEGISTLNIFVSFEFNRENELKDNFYRQAEEHCPHHIRNCSLNEEYPDERWKGKAREAIRECHVIIVLIGQDTHNAQGVIVETDIARSLNKPTFQIRPQGRPYNGLTRLGEPIKWKWKNINAKLDYIASGSG